MFGAFSGNIILRETFTTNSRDETEALGATFSKRLKKGDIVAFYGDLGAGKTAFIRGVLTALGAEDHITSPTFTIVNEYPLPDFLAAHFDMYRIESEDALDGSGFYDYLERALVLIEWSENIEWALDDDIIRVKIEGSGEQPRDIVITMPDS